MFALFNVMTESLLSALPFGVRTWLETGVSAKRIQVKTGHKSNYF